MFAQLRFLLLSVLPLASVALPVLGHFAGVVLLTLALLGFACPSCLTCITPPTCAQGSCCASPHELPTTLYCTFANTSSCACLDGVVVTLTQQAGGSCIWSGTVTATCSYATFPAASYCTVVHQCCQCSSMTINVSWDCATKLLTVDAKGFGATGSDPCVCTGCPTVGAACDQIDYSYAGQGTPPSSSNSPDGGYTLCPPGVSLHYSGLQWWNPSDTLPAYACSGSFAATVSQ